MLKMVLQITCIQEFPGFVTESESSLQGRGKERDGCLCPRKDAEMLKMKNLVPNFSIDNVHLVCNAHPNNSVTSFDV
jgi:hypothetical protein